MPSARINKNHNDDFYFLTLTIKRWYYLFDRHNRWQILLNSLKYCQANKGLKIYNWVFMLNHIHLIIRSDDMIGFIRDFKTFTPKELKKNVIETEPNILNLFEENGQYQFWQSTNKPERIYSDKFYITKANYIEQNPVRKYYVKNPEDWIYSSANRKDNLLVLVSL
jgi:putative transposase